MNQDSFVRDGTGAQYPALPKLNTALLEECMNWAIASYHGELAPSEPVHNQGSWNMYAKIDRRLGITKRFQRWSVPSNNYTDGAWNAQLAEKNFCGTAYCMSGRGLQLTGNLQQPVPNADYVSIGEVYCNVQKVVPKKDFVAWDPAPLAEMAPTFEPDFTAAGQAVFGLTYTEAMLFFTGSNTIHDLVAQANRIADSRGEELHLTKLDREKAKAAYKRATALRKKVLS